MQALSLPMERCDGLPARFAAGAVKLALRPLQAAMIAPAFLFLVTLTAMLLWNPNVPFYEINRFTFGLLVLGVAGRAVVLRQGLFVMERASWPMAALILMALGSMIGRPPDREAWAVLAAKYVVPFTVFHLAKLVFSEERRFRQFEVFVLAVLAYLSFTAIAFLAGAQFLIFPRFILDPSLGYHVDRARGPLLQAVANGVSLNLLGVLALHAYRRGSRRGALVALLLTSVPIAILATMTRAVWLSFAGTVLALVFLSKNARTSNDFLPANGRALRLACMVLVLVAGGLWIVDQSSPQLSQALSGRLAERGPVEFREAVYAGGWQMFLDRPLTGWGFHQMPAELPRYVDEYRNKVLYPHNTYLEILVEFGLPGLALYLWLMWELLRLRRETIPARERDGFLNAEFHRLWPILLGVYWVNAAVVVMNYHFVNCLIFTVAGMLAAQKRRAEAVGSC